MLIVKEEDKNVPPYSSKALVLNASPRFRSRAWDFRKCGLFLSIHPSPSEQSWKKMNLRNFSSATPSGSFCSLYTPRHSKVLFAHLADCGKVPPIKVWRNGFVVNDLCC